MALNAYVGYGVSTLLLWLINRGSNSADESSTASSPDTLSVGSTETRLGNPVPVILGRALVKSPAVAYFGDFHSEPYTETYAAHAKFNAWPLVLMLIMQYILMPFTGHSKSAGGQIGSVPVQGNPYGGQVSGVAVETTGATKDDRIGPLLNSLFIWLLNWLINGRHLKTTLQKGFKYFLGYQYLICWTGQEMRVRKLYLNEKQVWSGDVSYKAQNGRVLDVGIDDENLFGGPDEQGGFKGNLHVYLGGANQMPDGWMIQQMSGASVQAGLQGLTPAYRPFVSLVVPTAYIGKQATIPKLWIELQNCPNRLGLGPIGEDANPAECLLEILVNNDWGLAESEECLDLDALKKMGETLKQEGLGISIQLSSITKAQTLIDNICEHISAVRYSDPHTGKLVFKLIRDDYKIEDCLRLNVSNCSEVSLTRLDWSQIVSKISVTFTAAVALYEDASVPTQDPAAIELRKGSQTVKTYDCPYFTTASNALWAAKRELRTQAYPLATVSITGNRDLYELRIGDVVVLDWKPYGVQDMPVRVTDVDISELADGKIKIEGMEDIFGLGKTEFGYSDSTKWQQEDRYPTGVQHFAYLEMPYELMSITDTYVAAFAARPSQETVLWTVWRHPEHGDFAATSSLSKWTPTGQLVYGLDEFGDVEDLTGFEITDLGGIKDLPTSVEADINVARQGGRLLLIDDELIAYSTLLQLPNGHWQVRGVLRGVCDTVPKSHASLSNVFCIAAGTYQYTAGQSPVCASGETTRERYNICTASVAHTEEFDPAKAQSFETKKRSLLPSVPGHFRMSDYNEKDVRRVRKVAGDLSLSFVPRNNRQSLGMVSQDDTIEYFSTADFVAFEGTDYVVRLENGTETAEYTFPASPAVITWENYCNKIRSLKGGVTLSLYARRNGLLSYQAQERSFDWETPTLVDIVASEDEARERMKAWNGGDRIVMPKGTLSAEQTVMHKYIPVFLVGTAASDGDLYGWDGRKYKATNKLFIVTSKDTVQGYEMKKGYAFNSYFIPAASGGSVRSYEWTGTNIRERN